MRKVQTNKHINFKAIKNKKSLIILKKYKIRKHNFQIIILEFKNKINFIYQNQKKIDN